MKISNVKQQIKRHGRYSIFVDGKYSFSLSENELMASGIKIGKQYSKEEFEQLKKTAVFDKAYMRTLDLLARRTRSEWELRDYLKRKDYDANTVDLVIQRLKAKAYVDDLQFARAWIANRRLLKSTSKRKLQLELRQKRIADDVISVALERDETNDLDVIRELVAKKRQQTKYQDDLKLMQYLSRQGFNYDDIKTVMTR